MNKYEDLTQVAKLSFHTARGDGMGNAGAFLKAVADVKNVASDYNEFDAFRLVSGLRLLKP